MTSPQRRRVVAVLCELARQYRKRGKTASDRETPFEILIATILSARTKDETTHQVANLLFSRYKTPSALAGADERDVAARIRRIGFYRAKSRYIIRASRRIIAHHRGAVPRDEGALLKLPGVGRKTANIVRSYAFREPAIAVDTHVHRIANRLGWIRTTSPLESERALLHLVPKRLWSTVNDVFVKFGKDVCRPIGPQCWRCPVRRLCAYQPKRRKPAGTGARFHDRVPT